MRAWRLRQVALSALLAFGTQAVLAQPVGGQVVGGAASITHGANLTQIQQQSQRAIINWQSFGIPAGQTVQFQQPNAQAAILNRVTGALPTHIDGRLSANGQVFLVNPNGIVVGANGVISAQGGFVGSTQSISDAAFLAGAGLSFDGGSDGRMEVLGRIESANGPITLIAPKLSVGASASLQAGSAIQLIAASQVQLSNGKFTVIPKPGDAGELTQSGVLEAAQVQLAAVNQNLGALAINTSGTIRANATQTNPDGSVSIVATGPARVELHDASITATGADGKGGRIDVSGERTGLFGQTVLDASGAAGGGSVRVGGGWQGKEADLPNAQVTYVEEGVKLKADATLGGDGGRIVVWADDTTRYAGALSARGAGLKADGTQGAGGSAEVSGKGTLQFTGTADLRGASDQAQTGTLLLDPSNITIQAAGPNSNGGLSGTTWTSAGGGDSILTTATVQNQLATSHLVIQTTGTLSGAGGLGTGVQNDGVNGDIWLKDPLTWSGDTTLSLRAHDDVIIDAAVTASSSGSATAFRINEAAPVGGTLSTSRNVWINQPLAVRVISAGGNVVTFGAPISAAASLTVDTATTINVNADIQGATGGLVRLTSTNGGLNIAGVTITADSIQLTSGLPAGGAPDLTTSTILRPTRATDEFADLSLDGFRNITPNVRTSAGVARTDITSTGRIYMRSRELLDLSAYGNIKGGPTGDFALYGGDNVGYGWADAANGQLKLQSGATLTMGMGGYSKLTSGYAGNSRRDFTDVYLRYANPSNTFGDFLLGGFKDVALNLLDYSGAPTTLLQSNSSVAIVAERTLTLKENIKTGVSGGLALLGGANSGVLGGTIVSDYNYSPKGLGKIILAAPAHNFQVGTGGVFISSGDADPGPGVDRLNFTNATIQYRTGSGGSGGQFANGVAIVGMNDLTFRLTDSGGNLDPMLWAPGFDAIFRAYGIISVPQSIRGRNIGLGNYSTDWSATAEALALGQVLLRDPLDVSYSGPQYFIPDANIGSGGLSIASGSKLGTRTNFTNAVFGTAGASNTLFQGFNLYGLNDVEIRTDSTSGTLTVDHFRMGNNTGDIVFKNNTTANSLGIVAGRSMNNPGKQLVTPNLTLNFTGTSTQPSTINGDVTALSINGVLNAKNTVTVNELNNVAVYSYGDPASTADLKINAQGDIAIVNVATRSSSGGIYLQADADLSSIFGAGTGGGNGLGAVLGNGGATYSVPIFTAPFVYPGADFTYSVNGSGIITLTSGSGAGPTAFSALSNSAKQSFLNSLGKTIANNTSDTVTTNTKGAISGAANISPLANLQTFFVDAGGKVQMFVSGYTTAGFGAFATPQLSYQWKSGGTSAAALTLTTVGGDVTLDRSGSWVVGSQTFNVLSGSDTVGNLADVSGATGPADAAYWGKPLPGSANLNMSGQFYSLASAAVTLPTPVTASTLTPTSQTGWLRYTSTAAVNIGSGDFVAAGAARATDGTFVDMSLGSNQDQGLGIPGNTGSSLRITSAGGSVMMSGYRDIFLRDTTGLSLGAGGVALQAGRDVYLNANPSGGSTTGSVALIAGGAITTAPGVVLGGTGAGSGAVYLQAGQGLSVTTNLTAIEGGLGFAGGDGRYLGAGLTSGPGLDAGNYAIMLASGLRNTLSAATAAATSFKVLETDQGNNGLTIGSASATYRVWNSTTRSVDTVSPVGLSVTPDANNAAPLTTNVAIYQQNAARALTVTEVIAFDTTAQSANGEINLRSGGNLALNASITSAGGNRNLFLEAGGSITQTAGTLTGAAAVLTAGGAMGASGQAIQTRLATLATSSGGNQFVQEADDLTLAARSTAGGTIDISAGGALSVGSVALTPVAAAPAASGTPGTLTGVTANGSGGIKLSSGAGADVLLGQQVRSGTGNVTVTAGGNIVDAMAGDLASDGSETSASARLNLATGGNMALSAGNSVGSTGTGAPDALEIWVGGTLSSSSAGTTGDAGTYLNLLHTAGSSLSVVGISSARTVDLTSRASTTGAGNLNASTITSAGNGGYVRLAADANLRLQQAVTAAGNGNIVLQAGLGGSGDLTQDATAAVTAGSGEINLRAAGQIVQGASMTTAGNILAQAGTQIASTGGVWTSTGAAVSLKSGAGIGSAGNRVGVQAAAVVAQSAGDQSLSLGGGATQLAAVSSGGGVDALAPAGSITVGQAGAASGLTAVTGAIGTTASGSGGTLSGVTAAGAISLAARGATADLTLQRDVSSSAAGVTLQADRDVSFTLNTAQANAAAAVTVGAGRNIVNATGQGGTGGRDQIKGASATLTAGGAIGSGVIDDTLAGTSNVQDFNIDATQLRAMASGGDAVLWTRGGVQLTGASGASGRFGLNAGGAVTQAAGATLSAANVEIDTMRDATTGSVTLRNSGDLTVAGTNNVAGNYTATSQSGKVTVGGTLRANGDVTLTGTSVQITGTVQQSGNVVQNGVITNAGGVVLANVVVSGSVATVNASGAGANADLSQLLTPAVLAGLPGGVTTITVSLANTITTYSVAALTNAAVTLNNAGNSVTGGWTVRTGTGLGAATQTQRNWNLTDSGAAVDLGSRALEVNAARGTANAAGSQASSVTAVANAANTIAGFDAAKGSSVTLSQTRTTGVVTVKDANDVVIDTPAAVNLGYVYANGKLDVHSAGAMTVSGTQRAGGAYARLAADGKLDIQSTVTATGSGNVVLQAGLGGAGDLVQGAAVTSGSGEVNVRAAGNIAQGAAITTAGNILAQSGGAITSTGGVWSSTAPSGSVALRAGSTLGAAGNRVTVQAANVASQSGGDQYVALQGLATQVAASSSAGGVDLRAGAGSLTVGDVNVASGLTAGTGGIGATAAGTGGALQGVTSSGAASVAAVGATSDLTLNRDVSSTGSTVAITSGRDVTFSLNNAQANASGAVTVTSGRDILNATGQGGAAGRDQIKGGSVVLSAGGKIGSGVIDDTLAGTSNLQDLNIDATQLQAKASGGDVVLWTRGSVQLTGASSATGRFGLNAGGAVTQAAGATLSAADVEIDTMRDATIGTVALQNSGNLTVTGTNNVGGHFSATSQSGQVNVAGTLRVNGDVALSGSSILITGTLEQTGNLTQNGVIINAGGSLLATVSFSDVTATINAYGAGASFDLSQLLTPAVLAGMPSSVTTITVNLGGTVNTYSVAALTGAAITLNNSGNAVTGGWTVRTGQALGAAVQTERNWNLTDAGAPIDLGGRGLEVNAARGTANAAGSQASSVMAVANAANTAAGFDAAKGSSVTLSQTRTTGSVVIKDANDVQIDTPAAANLGYIYANGKLDVHSAGDLTVSGTQRAGSAYARLAADGKLDIQNTVTAAGSGNVVLQAGLGGSGDLVQGAAITSGSGEVNVRAAGNITQGAAITTAGDILAQSGGAITSTGGVWSSTAPGGSVALRAGSTVGTAGNRVTVQAANVASLSKGDQYVALQGAATQVAASSTAGAADLWAGAGSLTVGDLDVTSSLTAATGGIGATAVGTGGLLQGVSASGAASVAAVGATSDLTLNRDVSSTGSAVAITSGRDVSFSLNSAQANASGAVTVTSGRDILNATGQGGASGRDQIKGSSVVLSAGGKIGSGVIDDTLAGTSNVQDLNIDTTQLQATASGGDAVLWTRGVVQLTGASSASGRFGLNAGGAVTQAAGSTLSATDVEIDTMRDSTTGSVALRNSGDLTVAGMNNVGGNYAATSQSGKVTVGGTLKANGDVTLAGTSVLITGTLEQAGKLIQNGVIVREDGSPVAKLAVSGSQATVTAYGSTAAFDLAQVLSPAVLAGLPAGVTTVTVDLGTTLQSYSVASLLNPAIALNNAGNAVSGGWTVRTGGALGAATPTARNWNLSDAGAAVDLGGRNVIINAARGTAYTAGAQSSGIAAVSNAANTAAGFDAALGSVVDLRQTRTSGSWTVRDAGQLTLSAPAGNLNVAYAHSNGTMGLHSQAANLVTQGAVRAGSHLIASAAQDLVLDLGTTIAAPNGRITLIADQASGTQPGPGRLINRVAGLNIVADAHDDVAFYAPWGGAVPQGYTTAVDVTDPRFVTNGLQVNGVAVPTDWAAQYWGASYAAQFGTSLTPGNGRFGSVRVWYKAPLAQLPATAPMPPAPPMLWLSQPLPPMPVETYRGEGFALIDCSANIPESRKASQLFGRTTMARLSVTSVNYLPIQDELSDGLGMPAKRRQEEVQQRCAQIETRGARSLRTSAAQQAPHPLGTAGERLIADSSTN